MWTPLFCVALLGSGCLLATATAPVTVSIGGLFSIFDSDGVPNHETMQLQAAFLMAVEAINNKTDGFYDSILPDTDLKIAVRGVNQRYNNAIAVSELLDAVDIGGDIGVHALVNGLITDPTKLTSSIIAEIVMDHSSSLVQGTEANIFDEAVVAAVEVSPLTTDQAWVLQEIICNHFKFRKMGIFFSTSQYGSKSLSEFTNGEYCDFEIHFEMAMEHENIELQISTIAQEDYDARVFVFLMDNPTAAGHLLETAYEAGLFRLGSQIFFVNEIMDVVGLAAGMSPGTDVARLLQGIIGVRFWPSYFFHAPLAGESDFFDRWQKLPSTLGAPGGPCNAATDDSGLRYLYQNDAGTVCAGLDYSSFSSIEEIVPSASFVFDAVVLAAMGLHKLLVTDALPLSSHADVYRQAVINATNSGGPFPGNVFAFLLY
jgi:hypothetical protein